MPHKGKASSFIPRKISLDCLVVDGPEGLCNFFADYFRSIFEIPSCCIGNNTSTGVNPKYMLSVVVEQEVRIHLENFNENKNAAWLQDKFCRWPIGLGSINCFYYYYKNTGSDHCLLKVVLNQ